MYRDVNKITMILEGKPDGIINPILWENELDLWILGCVFQGTMMFDENLKISNRITNKVVQNKDNTEYIIEFKENLFWQDRMPMTVEDLKFTIETLLKPRFKGNRGKHFLLIEGAEEYYKGMKNGIDGLKVLDSLTLEVKLIKPDASFKNRLLLPVIPRHIFKGHPIDDIINHPAVKSPIGCGPYKLVNIEGTRFKFVRNEYFHLGAPKIPYMEMVFESQKNVFEKIKNKEVDFAILTPEQTDNLKSIENDDFYKIHFLPKPQIEYIILNHRNRNISNQRFRQALMYALDRKEILQRSYGGYGENIHQYYPELLSEYIGNELNEYEYNPDLARKIFEQFPQMNLKLGIGIESKKHAESSKIVIDNLAKVGIDVDLIEYKDNKWMDDFRNNELDLFIYSSYIFLDPDPDLFIGERSVLNNIVGWDDEYNFELIRKGLRSKGRERIEAYQEWSQYINREVPLLFLYSPFDIQIINKHIQGIRPDPRGLLWNIHELTNTGGYSE
ncbi:oligopeptide ABC transporter oligopeptide-binding protein [Bacillus sp. UMTAT18]|nr:MULTISPECIES: ABC transporter substrate-binding protein [unclassified Bacillus (in: firmicutes)]KKC57484.1 oligopeptide ABC transporter oligopeptide-binding protein [Bacillus sp. UMTAT18]MDU2389978.1 ABC transporter substrate-binding protein [Bacillus sp. (in: firmicutes)]OJD79823.1 hypothetical protein BAU29_01795 [Bacillus sp. P14-1]